MSEAILWMGDIVPLVQFANTCLNIMHGRRKYMNHVTQKLYDYLQNIRIKPTEEEQNKMYAPSVRNVNDSLRLWQLTRIYKYLRKTRTALETAIRSV